MEKAEIHVHWQQSYPGPGGVKTGTAREASAWCTDALKIREDSPCIPLDLVRTVAAFRPGVWTFIDRVRAERGKSCKNWPDWCFCPIKFFFQVVMRDIPRERRKEAMRNMSPTELRERRTLAENLPALAAWRMGMSIYRFDPTLAQSLIETPVDKLPAEALYRLPEWCVYIEAPPGLPQHILGFFAYLNFQYHDERATLNLTYVMRRKTPGASPYVHLLFLFLDQPTIEEGILAALTHSIANRFDCERAWHMTRERALEIAHGESRFALPACLNLVLYLCAGEADFGGKARPRNPKPVKTKKGMKLFSASAPRYWSVGQTLGDKLREAERLQSASGRSGPAPHLRRAHWHTYWVGKGRKKLDVRWLHPILVGVNAEKATPDAARD